MLEDFLTALAGTFLIIIGLGILLITLNEIGVLLIRDWKIKLKAIKAILRNQAVAFNLTIKDGGIFISEYSIDAVFYNVNVIHLAEKQFIKKASLWSRFKRLIITAMKQV